MTTNCSQVIIRCRQLVSRTCLVYAELSRDTIRIASEVKVEDQDTFDLKKSGPEGATTTIMYATKQLPNGNFEWVPFLMVPCKNSRPR